MLDFNNINLTTKEKIRFLKALSIYADDRLSQINNKIDNSNSLLLDTILQIVIAMNLYLKSLVELLETSNIIAANFLYRSLLESFINIGYIMRDDTQKRSAIFGLEDIATQKITINTIKELIKDNPSEVNFRPELSTIEKCDEQIEIIDDFKKNILSNLKDNYGIEIKESEKLKFPSVEQRANDAGLKNLYNILYRQLCWVTHSTASGLKQLIKVENNKYIIPPIDTEEEIKKMIPIAYDIYLLTLENLMKKFDLYIEEDFKAMEEISNKLKIS